MSNSKGLTLVELMATVAIAGILLTLAVPSFRDLVEDSRITGQTNNLIAALNLARSEAARRGQAVEVAGAESGTDWSGGWLVRVVNTAEVLRRGEALAGDVSLTASAASVAFDPTGFARATATFDLCAGGDDPAGRRVNVTASGRAESAYLPCP